MGNLQLIIPRDIYLQLTAYLEVCSIEFSTLIDADYDEKRGAFVLGKIYLLEQEATGSTVELDDDAVDKFNFQMIKAGATQLPRCWMHSHANFKAFFSPTDENTIKSFQNESFNVALVMNKAHELKAKAYIKATMLGKEDYVEIDDLPVYIEYNDEAVLALATSEIAEKVKTPKLVPLAGGYAAGWHNDSGLGNSGSNHDSSDFRSLPRTKALAKNFIEQNNLEERYDFSLKESVYVSPLTGITYYDDECVLID